MQSKNAGDDFAWRGVTAHKLARNSAGCARSQAVQVERFIAFGRGVMQKSIEMRSGLWRSESALPRFVILTGEEEAGKVGQLGLLVSGQSLANMDDFLCSATHVNMIAANRESESERVSPRKRAFCILHFAFSLICSSADFICFKFSSINLRPPCQPSSP